MTRPLNRRNFLAATSAGLASAALEPIASAAPDEQAQPKRLTLLHFADIHAQLETHPEYLPGAKPNFRPMGGFARLKTAIERERATAVGPSFLLDGGDEFQGSAPAAWSEGEVILRPLNALGADVFVPGNWEAVYGPDRFRLLMRRLTAQVACFNLHDVESGQRLFEPAILIERQGVRVAFVGVTDVFASRRQPPREFRGMDTARIAGLERFVRELKAEQKPDLIVAVTHTGLTTSRKLARDIPEFDIVLSGHTHERTERALLEGKTIVVEPGSMGSFLGRLELTLKPEGGVAEHAFRLIPIDAGDFEEDPRVKSLVDAELKPFRERMEQTAGATLTPIFRYDVLETSADDFITDAVREISGADIGLSNGFRFGVPIMPGEITEADLWSLLPMDARMKIGWVTGKELKAYLEKELELVYSADPKKLSGGWGPRASGMSIRYRALAEPGRRLISVQVAGKEVQDDERYTIAGCEREGEPLDVICRHPGAHDPRILPQKIHAALRDYLKAHPCISPLREGRAVAVDFPPVLFSLDGWLAQRMK